MTKYMTPEQITDLRCVYGFGAAHLLAYVLGALWLWRSANRRLRMQCRPAAPPVEALPELPPLAAKEAVA